MKIFYFLFFRAGGRCGGEKRWILEQMYFGVLSSR